MYHPAASLRNGNVLEAEKIDFVNLRIKQFWLRFRSQKML